MAHKGVAIYSPQACQCDCLLTWNCHWVASSSQSFWCAIPNSTGIVPTIITIAYIHHQDAALLDLGCPHRINCSCITRAPRTGPLIAQHSGGWHSYNSAHQNQGGALLHRSSVGVGINDNCTEMLEMVKPKIIIIWFTVCMKYIITHNQL